MFAVIRADVRRPWDLWTSIYLVACFVLLAIEKLFFYRPALVRGGFALRVCFWGLLLLLGFFVGAAVSLLRRGVPRAVPALLLLLVVSLGGVQIFMALMFLFMGLMWLLFALVDFASRLLRPSLTWLLFVLLNFAYFLLRRDW